MSLSNAIILPYLSLLNIVRFFEIHKIHNDTQDLITNCKLTNYRREEAGDSNVNSQLRQNEQQ